MPTKYVLWRVSNGWIVTLGNTLWEDWDRRKFYGVFRSLQEFINWVPPEPGEPPAPQPQPRIRGKFAPKLNSRKETKR